MRWLVWVAIGVPCVAFADEAPKKPKGHIVDPWGRMPRPRDHMRLPDPRKAAEKAAADGVVAPTTPESTTSEPTTPEPAPEPAAALVEPPAAPPFVPAAATVIDLPPPRSPFRVTTLTYTPPPPPAPHAGFTLEAGTGVGWIHLADRSNAVTSPGGVAGVSFGVGGWLSESAALTLRLAGSSVPSSQGLVVAAFFGPSLQLWASAQTWFSVGLGISTLSLDSANGPDYALDGYAFDLRLGHTIYASGKHVLNGSVEVTPGSVGDGNGTRLSTASIGILVGYQYL